MKITFIATDEGQRCGCANMLRIFLVVFLLSPVKCASFFDNFGDTLKNWTATYYGIEDSHLNVEQLASKHGYPLETHTVTTQDDYILTIHRIPSNEKSNKTVLLMPGVLENSIGWLIQGPNKALAYILADKGYDVWMGNVRGSKNCLRHKNYNSKTATFWNFSWEEMGVYDVPAIIVYILNETGDQSVYYVGFSVGTTYYFVMNSMKPEYNDKIKLMVALTPVVFTGHVKTALLKNLPGLYMLHDYLTTIGTYTPSAILYNKLWPFLCKMFPSICSALLKELNGPNEISDNIWPIILGHVPNGASSLELVHYGQITNSKRFCRLDYGDIGNMEKYGQSKPPDYNLQSVTSPVVLIHSENDWFADKIDVDLLVKKLPNVIETYSFEKLSHLDFMYAESMSTTVYPLIVEQFEHYRKRDITEHGNNTI